MQSQLLCITRIILRATILPNRPFNKHILCVALLFLMATAGLNAAPTHFTIERLGFTGTGYTESSGYQYSQVLSLNNQGQVVGYSTRYSGTMDLGRDTWLYDGNSTLQMGFTGTGYERSDGYRLSSSNSYGMSLNDQGQVAGYSRRYSGTTGLGEDAWLYDGNSTLQMGFTGTGYERSDGYRYSFPKFLNDQGQVAGYSRRDSGTTHLGQDAWLYDANSTVQMGFTGAGYTRSDGYRFSDAQFLNDQGQVAGYSYRYSEGGGATQLGQDVWLHDGSTTLQMGFTGAGYTRSDGYRLSTAWFLNDQGQAAGNSLRYSGTTELGVDAWLYDGSITLQMGLTGAGYERSDGYRGNLAWFLNDQGHVAGISKRYSGTTGLGEDAWLYDGSITLQMGFTGTGYERGDGYRESDARFLNDEGQVAGYSRRYSGMAELGADTWLYDGNSTLQMGLTGAGYERSDGYRGSTASFLNDEGQVAGGSDRYSEGGGAYLGQDAWLYDADLNQTFNLSLSIRPSDHYADSWVYYLGDDGLVLGSYTLFDQTSGADLGSHAFYFTVGNGLYDLGLLVDDLTPDGWLALATAISAGGMREFIIGGGTLTGMTGQAAYLLTAVPVPAAIWLFGGALGLLSIAQRRSTA